MQISIRALLCAVFGLCFVPLKSTVTEFVALSHPQRDVYLLFDEHLEVPGVSTGKMERQSFDAFKSNFFPSERVTLDAFKAINGSPAAHTVDIIWESSTPGFTDQGATQFLAYGSTLVNKHCKKLNLIHSDQARVRFEEPFLHGFNKRRDLDIYQNAIPLPQERINRIVQNSGPRVWSAYKGYYDRSKRELQTQFKPHVDNQAQLWEDYFEQNDPFDRICDVEMLSHLFASAKRSVIIYAGGWHCHNIQQILEAEGYRVTRHIGNGNREIDGSFGQALYSDIMAASGQGNQPSRPGTQLAKMGPTTAAVKQVYKQPVAQKQQNVSYKAPVKKLQAAPQKSATPYKQPVKNGVKFTPLKKQTQFKKPVQSKIPAKQLYKMAAKNPVLFKKMVSVATNKAQPQQKVVAQPKQAFKPLPKKVPALQKYDYYDENEYDNFENAISYRGYDDLNRSYDCECGQCYA